ncbi:hypothetical protein M3226_13335 [Neobacillus cucumis]|uniref:hypothetical protein n=1 Tax=Neobacillus cucumis TaxID=1740721 RepID=UPI00203FC8AD|nr:hypothetical protein [Neobacillus cucumis]MCM3726671.1 hypothetical protein [Neobacillus cucumis]
MKCKTLLAGGLAALLTFGGLAGCGDGVDQDNGISDGQQKDAVDNSTKQSAKENLTEAKNNLKDIKNDVEKEIKQDTNN